MTTAAPPARTLSIEHVTIVSSMSFADTRARLEAALPTIDGEIRALIEAKDAQTLRRKLDSAPTLSIFEARDHGSLLVIAGEARNAVQFEIGNQRTAAGMTRHHISAALYAPLRVLLREDDRGEVAFEYDRPVSVFGQFGNRAIDDIARQLEDDLRSALLSAAGVSDAGPQLSP